MLAVCSRSSGYWDVDTLAKVNDRDEFNALYDEEMTSEESTKVVFILYALKIFETNCSVRDVTYS
jgi:hypothetical protein